MKVEPSTPHLLELSCPTLSHLNILFSDPHLVLTHKTHPHSSWVSCLRASHLTWVQWYPGSELCSSVSCQQQLDHHLAHRVEPLFRPMSLSFMQYLRAMLEALEQQSTRFVIQNVVHALAAASNPRRVQKCRISGPLSGWDAH